MSKNYRLVYMLAVRDSQGQFDPLVEHGEFVNRAAAKEYIADKKFDTDIHLIRKEVSLFYDRKLVDKED